MLLQFNSTGVSSAGPTASGEIPEPFLFPGQSQPVETKQQDGYSMIQARTRCRGILGFPVCNFGDSPLQPPQQGSPPSVFIAVELINQRLREPLRVREMGDVGWMDSNLHDYQPDRMSQQSEIIVRVLPPDYPHLMSGLLELHGLNDGNR